MTDNDEIEFDEAQEALHAIKEAESAGLGSAIPPRWFGVVVALISGALIASAAAGESQNVALLILAFALVIGVRQQKSGALPKAFPSNATGIFAIIALLAFALLLIAGAKALAVTYGFAWAPLAGGALTAAIVYILSIFERRLCLAKVNAGRGQ